MKQIISPLVVAFLLLSFSSTFGASNPIPQTNYVVQNFSSDNTNHPVADAFDSDTTTWWALYNAAGFSLPGTVELDLGISYDVNGFSYLPNPTNSTDKAIGYEVYLSTNGTAWGTPEITGDFNWTNSSDVSRQNIYFGAISARYVKVVYTSSQNTGNNNIHTGDLVIFESTTAATGQANQQMTFNPISKHYATDAPFTMTSVASSGLSVTYSIISGPATVLGNTITLAGSAGTVVVQAEQVGDASYYPISQTQSFNVVDLSIIHPTVSTKLTDAFPIEMPVLNAYPIYVSTSIDEPAQLSVTSVEFEINGAVISAYAQDGYYLGWWTPSATGSYNVNVKAKGSNGNVTTETVSVDVVTTAATQNVQTFDGDLVNFTGSGASRWFYGTYTLPQSVGAYDQIIANFAVTCPAVSGGCDDWDRLAYAEYKAPDGTWMELFRYITPYGVACNHSIDVTDFASLLHGNIEIRMFIDTWGTGGWDLHLDFDYIEGTPAHLYSSIQEVWHGDYNFGNPNKLQPCDTVSIDYPTNTQKATFRLTTTGHGWGSTNTSNAAEFYNATHNFHVNGISTYTQNLWNTCNPNPDNCTGQQGTWTYDRAGWCPGTIAPPNTYDLTSQIGNTPFDFAYVFQQSYQDNCHPNNPSCVTGVTCSDCNAGYNPFYRVGAYMISFSNSPISSGIIGLEEEANFDLSLYPNPNNGIFKMNITRDMGEVVVTINDISGATAKTYYFNGKTDLDAYQFDISSLSKGTYFINVKNEYQSTVKKVILN